MQSLRVELARPELALLDEWSGQWLLGQCQVT